MDTFIALLAGIGIGSIISAIIGWLVAISNHRQAWINALRDDLATFFKELQVMHQAIGDLLQGIESADLEKKKQEARVSILFVYSRIVLRLNRTEKMHADLKQKIEELMTIRDRVPDPAKIEVVIDLARQILKREWEVTKYGPVSPLVIGAKEWWRGSK